MRVLGFSKKWDKLSFEEFTTFRFTRRDYDWSAGESVQVVYKPRTKNREVLGAAEIILKEAVWADEVDHKDGVRLLNSPEAVADGFPNGRWEMIAWFRKTHNDRNYDEPINKLTLKWIQKR